eukprot:4642071-Amphidinium_carterae.1
MGLWRLSGPHWRLMRKQGFDVEALKVVAEADKCLKDLRVSAGRAPAVPPINAWLACAMQQQQGPSDPMAAGQHVEEPDAWDCHPEYYVDIRDNITGKPLDPALVAEGRRQEMEFLR